MKRLYNEISCSLYKEESKEPREHKKERAQREETPEKERPEIKHEDS